MKDTGRRKIRYGMPLTPGDGGMADCAVRGGRIVRGMPVPASIDRTVERFSATSVRVRPIAGEVDELLAAPARAVCRRCLAGDGHPDRCRVHWRRISPPAWRPGHRHHNRGDALGGDRDRTLLRRWPNLVDHCKHSDWSGDADRVETARDPRCTRTPGGVCDGYAVPGPPSG